MSVTLFSQIMTAFGGYSPGGTSDFIDDESDREAVFLPREVVESRPDGRAAVEALNKTDLVGGVSEVRIVEQLPCRSVYCFRDGRMVRVRLKPGHPLYRGEKASPA